MRTPLTIATFFLAIATPGLPAQCILTETQVFNGQSGESYGGNGEGEEASQPIALAGDLLLIAVPGRGRVDVYRNDGSDWTLEQQLFGSGTFGYNVALTDSRVVVGAPRDDNGTGAVHLFKHDGSAWVLDHTLLASDGAQGDWFGADVAANGQWIAVGAPFGPHGGAVYLYRRESGFWSETRLQPSEAHGGRQFGVCLALTHDTLFVGAPGEDAQSVLDGGAVFSFERSNAIWSETQVITSSEPIEREWFGFSVAASAQRLAIGTFWFNEPQNGAVYCFQRNQGLWANSQRITTSPYGQFGSALSMTDDLLVIGQREALDEGRCFAYGLHEGQWRLFGDLRHPFIGSGGRLGHSVLVSGTTCLVADPKTQSGTGLVALFDVPPLILEVTPTDPAAGDTLIFETCRGLAGGLAALTLIELNGSPLFDIVTMGTFDANGKWSIQATVPPGLAGLRAAFQSIGFVEDRKLELSNRSELDFR